MFSTLLKQSAARSLRSFSDAAAHKPPIDVYGLAARYANATYTAASKAGNLEKVEGELLALQQTARTNAQFHDFIQNPLISRDDKVKQVTQLLGKKTTTTTLNLMTTLAGNARLTELDKIVDTYCKLLKAKRGEVEATIISAEPLTKAQTDAIQKAVLSQVGSDKKVMIDSKVNPSIVGGLQVQIGDQFLDLSVASRIDAISRTPV